MANWEQLQSGGHGIDWHILDSHLLGIRREDNIEVIVANPYMIKHIPGKKTDLTDSEWLAELCLNGLIMPSRIFPKEARVLRSLTRGREGLVKIKTHLKNKIHRDLASSHIKLSSVIADIFGKSGMYIIS